MHYRSCCYFSTTGIVAILGFIAVCLNGLFSGVGLVEETELLITVPTWLFVWSFLAAIVTVFGFGDVLFSKDDKGSHVPVLGWALTLALFVPWAPFGVIALDRRLDAASMSVGTAPGFTIGVAIAALVVSYIGIGVPVSYAVMNRVARA